MKRPPVGNAGPVPELPEVENAREVVEKALHRTITEIDDTDEFVCRPHRPGEISKALAGGRLTAAHRRGKTMWCDTVTADGSDGPLLAIHLGMGGRIFVTGASHSRSDQGGTPIGEPGHEDGEHSSGEGYSGGDPDLGERSDGGGVNVGSMPTRPNERPQKPEWDRVTIGFDDGGELRLFDKRRLARVHLEPDLDTLGPDAAEITRDEFRARVGRGTAPIKARLLDQSVLAGVGNLLADQTLWQARLSPSRPAAELSAEELDGLRRELRKATRSAVAKGGVHTGEMIPRRKPGESCPRCGAEMVRGTVGGRTTWWCSAEQECGDRR